MPEKLGIRLRREREYLGITQEELSQALGLSDQYISAIEIGSRSPSLETLVKIAGYFKRDTAFFLTPRENPFHFLMNDRKVSAKLKNEIKKFQGYCRDYLALEEITGRRLNPAPGYSSGTPEELARAERGRIGLGEEPIRDIFSLVELNGLRLLRKVIPDEAKIAGMLVYDADHDATFGLINSSYSLGRQIMVTAHLYCHYLKDRESEPIIDNPDIFIDEYLPLYHPREKFAQRFAECFLVSESKLSSLLPHSRAARKVGFEDIVMFKRYFGIELSVMLNIMHKMEIISLSRYREFQKMDSLNYEKTLFGDIKEDQPPSPKLKGLITSERYKTLGVIALQRKNREAD